MSMRLRGLLMDKYSSKVENSYMRSDDVIVLDNVPCEMMFESANVFMEHENAAHNYLPVFHLCGQIKEIHGNFPFNVTTLFFTEEDMQYLMKDCIYYPTPEELAYMITSGKFYSQQFQIPEILDHNTYTFPANICLTIVPPPNMAAYEVATFEGIVNNEAAGVDKSNLPIFYVGIRGTGVSPKNDKLLSYYGIQLDEDFDAFVLTADSSGYKDPPLLMYIPEPVVEPEPEVEHSDDYYLSSEDEAELIRAEQEQNDMDNERLAEHTDADYQMDDMESMIVAKADRNIERRIAARQLGDVQLEQTVNRTLEAVEPAVEEKVQQKDSGIVYEKMAEPVQETIGPEDTRELEDDDITADSEPDEEYIEDEYVEGVDVSADEPDHGTVVDEAVVGVDVTDEALAYNQEKLTQPDNPQQYKENQMDFNPDRNTYVDQAREEDDIFVDEDDHTLEDMKGADVEDAQLQAKIEDEKSRTMGQNAAIQAQEDVKEDSEQVHREAPYQMQELAEKYATGVDEDLGVSF